MKAATTQLPQPPGTTDRAAASARLESAIIDHDATTANRFSVNVIVVCDGIRRRQPAAAAARRDKGVMRLICTPKCFWQTPWCARRRVADHNPRRLDSHARRKTKGIASPGPSSSAFQKINSNPRVAYAASSQRDTTATGGESREQEASAAEEAVSVDSCTSLRVPSRRSFTTEACVGVGVGKQAAMILICIRAGGAERWEMGDGPWPWRTARAHLGSGQLRSAQVSAPSGDVIHRLSLPRPESHSGLVVFLARAGARSGQPKLGPGVSAGE